MLPFTPPVVPSAFKTTSRPIPNFGIIPSPKKTYSPAIVRSVDPLHSFAGTIQRHCGLVLSPKIANHLLINLCPNLSHDKTTAPLATQSQLATASDTLYILAGVRNQAKHGGKTDVTLGELGEWFLANEAKLTDANLTGKMQRIATYQALEEYTYFKALEKCTALKSPWPESTRSTYYPKAQSLNDLAASLKDHLQTSYGVPKTQFNKFVKNLCELKDPNTVQEFILNQKLIAI